MTFELGAPCVEGGSWQTAVQDGVLTATVGATLKLFLVCGLIGWLIHSGRISDETAPVLSKVQHDS